MEGVCRRFYGLQLDGDYRSKFGSEEPPSQNSTMTKPTPIRMIQTPNQNVLNNRLLARIQTFSAKIQKETGKLITSSWKTFFHSFLKGLPRAQHTKWTSFIKEEPSSIAPLIHKTLESLKKSIESEGVRMSLVDGNMLNADAWKKDLTLIGLGLPGLSYSKLNTPTPAMLDRGKNLNYLHNIEFLYMVWIMAHFGVTQEGQKTLRLFYSSTMNNIFDTTFLAIYVAIPVNVITQATINSLTRVLHEDCDIPKGRFDKGVKKKWKQMFRTLYGEMYLKVLMEYGRYPNAKKQPLVQKMINSEFGYTGTTQTRRN